MVNHLGPMLLVESLRSNGILCKGARIFLESSGASVLSSPSLIEHALKSPEYKPIGVELPNGTDL